MFKRIALFLATNLAVMVLFGLVLNVLQNFFGIRLGNNGQLLLIATLFGFGGALVSLLISKWMAKRTTGMHLIEQPRNEAELWLVNTVRRQAEAAGIKMPEVGIYDAPEINAFATGPSRNNSLVAVSTGLLRAMSRDEAEAVLGHEVSHVANGDMVTMTLIQGVVNAFVMFLSRIIASIVRNAADERYAYPLSIVVTIVLDIAFGFLGLIVVAWFSRAREFRADAGGASLAGRGSMIAALRRLQTTAGLVDNREPALATLKISGRRALLLFSTHPPLEDRIRALERG